MAKGVPCPKHEGWLANPQNVSDRLRAWLDAAHVLSQLYRALSALI